MRALGLGLRASRYPALCWVSAPWSMPERRCPEPGVSKPKVFTCSKARYLHRKNLSKPPDFRVGAFLCPLKVFLGFMVAVSHLTTATTIQTSEILVRPRRIRILPSWDRGINKKLKARVCDACQHHDARTSRKVTGLTSCFRLPHNRPGTP